MTAPPVIPQPTAIPRPRQRHSALFFISTVVLGLGALAVATLIVWSGGPIAAAIAYLLAAVPLPLLILLCLWLDRYQPEPVRYLMAAIAWGAVAAVGIGLGLSLAASALTGGNDTLNSVFWAPVTEEFGKGVFLIVVMVMRRDQLHGVLDGIVYGGLVGVGFTFTEDALYYLNSLSEGGIGATTALFIVRGVAGAFGHSLYAAVFGIGLGIAIGTRSRVLRVVAPILGYVGAVLLHATWNGSATFGGFRGFVTAYLVAILPALVALLTIGAWVRRREGQVLRTALTDCARRGWVHPGEVAWVALLPQRAAARKYAAARGGRQASRLLRDYQQTLTEMAFLHHRVMQGRAPKNADAQMAAILNRAAAYRPFLILPPPMTMPPSLERPHHVA